MTYSTFTDDKTVTPNRAIVTNVIVRAAADSVVNIRDGESGAIVVPIAVKNGETFSIAGKIAFNSGVYVDVVSGTVVGTVVFE